MRNVKGVLGLGLGLDADVDADAAMDGDENANGLGMKGGSGCWFPNLEVVVLVVCADSGYEV